MKTALPINKILLVIIVIAVAVNVVIILANTVFKKSEKVSNVILFTAPVYSIYGTVEKVSANALELKFMPSDAKLSARVFTVTLSDKTIISKGPSTIPYTFKTQNMSGNSAMGSVSDIQKGMAIAVTSKQDLRTLVGNSITATTVAISNESLPITGKIVSVSSSRIVVRGFLPLPPANSVAISPMVPKEETFTFEITKETELSQIPSSSRPEEPLQPVKISPTDIKTNSMVTVYFSGDISSGALQALLIQAQPEVAAPVPLGEVPSATKSASPAGTIKPTEIIKAQ